MILQSFKNSKGIKNVKKWNLTSLCVPSVLYIYISNEIPLNRYFKMQLIIIIKHLINPSSL